MFRTRIINFLSISLSRLENVRSLNLGYKWYCTESNSIIDREFNQLNNEFTTHLLPVGGHRVMLLQPARSHGKLYLKNGTEEQSACEARALINTLESWILIDEKRVNAREINGKTFFSKGIYDNLVEEIRERDDISAVFVNWSYLSSLQRMTLGKDFNKIVYDRFLMVLQIFKLHAKSTEAKLQVQLAQIPYFRSMLYGYHINSHSEDIINEVDKGLDGIPLSTTSLEEKYFFLKVKEHNIKEKIKDLEINRDLHRFARKQNDLPIIGVVGYTNAGKTSLIRHLTKDEKVQPKNCFFATLDVTYHDFFMKLNNNDCGMKAIILDSIGFLSEIPTNLIAAFRSTLKEAVDTDLLIHVVDISDRYWREQMTFTQNTLQSFNLPKILLESTITVGTKVDRIDPQQLHQMKIDIPNFIPISNLTGENIDLLQIKIVELLSKNKGYITKQIRIDQSTSVYQWIQSNAIIQNKKVALDGETLLLQVLFTPASWAKFQSQFRPKKL